MESKHETKWNVEACTTAEQKSVKLFRVSLTCLLSFLIKWAANHSFPVSHGSQSQSKRKRKDALEKKMANQEFLLSWTTREHNTFQSIKWGKLNQSKRLRVSLSILWLQLLVAIRNKNKNQIKMLQKPAGPDWRTKRKHDEHSDVSPFRSNFDHDCDFDCIRKELWKEGSENRLREEDDERPAESLLDFGWASSTGKELFGCKSVCCLVCGASLLSFAFHFYFYAQLARFLRWQGIRLVCFFLLSRFFLISWSLSCVLLSPGRTQCRSVSSQSPWIWRFLSWILHFLCWRSKRWGFNLERGTCSCSLDGFAGEHEEPRRWLRDFWCHGVFSSFCLIPALVLVTTLLSFWLQNTTVARRKWVKVLVESFGFRPLFIESICDDPDVLDGSASVVSVSVPWSCHRLFLNFPFFAFSQHRIETPKWWLPENAWRPGESRFYEAGSRIWKALWIHL